MIMSSTDKKADKMINKRKAVDMEEDTAQDPSTEPQQKTENREITEGKAKIRFQGSASAFYNPAQEFNRDLSITITRFFISQRKQAKEDLERELSGDANGTRAEPSKKKRKQLKDCEGGVRLLEALAATGLRSVRYAQEVGDGLESVLANDFSESAVELMKQNIADNGVGDVVTANFQDAIEVMHRHKAMDRRFHIVDLDPYGSASQFLDSAVQSVQDDGILMVTCTDMAVLCGNAPETCWAKYGSTAVRSKACHEGAVRIVLRCIESHANRYSRYVIPLLSLHIDFYVRIFVKLRTGQVNVKNSICKLSNLYQCQGCGSMEWQPLAKREETAGGGSNAAASEAGTANKPFKYSTPSPAVSGLNCPHCRSRFHIAGPYWTDPIHNYDFVRGLLKHIKDTPEERRMNTHSRMIGMLSVVEEEIPNVPMFYELTDMVRLGKIGAPKLSKFKSALLNAGYSVSTSHCNPMAIKTTAPSVFLWDVIRALSKDCKDRRKDPQENSPCYHIMNTEMAHKIDFTIHPLAESKARLEGLLRYQDNRGKNWGPQNKAKGSIHSVHAGAYGAVKPSSTNNEHSSMNP